jgi:hypothetical protein
MRNYGRTTIARYRLDGLVAAADRFFVTTPIQELEGTFHELMIPLRALASRRNEVAHAIVMDISKIQVFLAHLALDALGRAQYAAIAPYYQLKQHAQDGLPAYAYTRTNMYLLQLKMAEIYRRADALRRSLLLLINDASAAAA